MLNTDEAYQWMMLNTEKAAKGNPGSAGGGGIIQGPQGEFVEAFMERFGVCTSTRAELKAMFREASNGAELKD